MPRLGRAARRLPSAALALLLLTAAAPAPDATPPAASQPSADAVLDHLNAVISWYRQVKTADASAGQPGDTIYLDNAKALSRKTVDAAFQAAEAQAPVIDALAPPAAAQSGAPKAATQESRLHRTAAQAEAHVRQLQAEIDKLGKQIAVTPARKRKALVAQKEKLGADLQLATALSDALHDIVTVADANDGGGAPGLMGKIAEIRRQLPEALSTPPAAEAKPGGKADVPAAAANAGGLIGGVSLLMTRMRQLHDADQMVADADSLSDGTKQLLAPLRDAIKEIIKKGNDAAKQTATPTPQQLDAFRAQLQALTGQFKQYAAAVVPLHQEAALLQQSRAALDQWRSSVRKQYARALRGVLTQLAVIIAALGVVLVLSELTRRATLRYVRDLRRRRQLTIMRRSVSSVLMALVIVAGFIREIGSLATFAGFLTAGVAVALQTVLLSVAAYFLLIGRYGVRIGDRITVSGITGDVVEIGLVRVYLLELGASGVNLYPTGRIVAFANSVLFQSAPFFKQIPGTAYTWREVALTLIPDADFAAAERRILEVVNKIYEEYRGALQRQHSSIEQLFDVPVAMPAPHAQLHLTGAGLEFVVRYPVEIARAAEIDEKVTRTLTEAIAKFDEVKAAVSALPQIRAAVKS
jgi:small-conductance mechanosensitive channel